MLSRIKEVAHSVIVETLANIFENIYSINNNTLGGFKKELLRMKESLSHPLDLLVVVVVDFATVVKHVTDI